MKTLTTFAVASGLALAGSLPRTEIRGSYVEARTADIYTGPCFANSEVELTGHEAVFGWRIDKGSFQGVKLDGLSVVAVVKANATLGDVHNSAYPAKSVLIVDEKANAEQRLALKGFAQRMGGDLLAKVVRVEFQPIEFSVKNDDVHSASAKVVAGNLAQLATRPISDKDHICSNEEIWYSPLTKTDHAMPAYALAHKYAGEGLGTVWSSPEKRSAFVANFSLSE
ncbi:MAG: DUF1326 domain-containing protein [Acidobacteria bacterium]|nr:DUF1326 domain-containing protein [Acidobacteriota bacterium]